jgi:hypothetical protein
METFMLLKSRFRISILILKVVKALALLVAIEGPKKVSISLEIALEIDLPTSKSILPAPCKQQVHYRFALS